MLWTLKPNSEVVVASPIVTDGMAFVTAGYPPVRPVYAVRAGQRGDLTLPDGQPSSAAIAWSHPRGGTYIPTPLLYRGHLYTVNNNGILTCYRADTGEQVYQTRLGAVRRLLRGLAGRGRRAALLRRARPARSTSCARAPSSSCWRRTSWTRW